MVRKRISLAAPMSLPEGYEIEANINNKTIIIVVPKGGVYEGEILQVSIDPNSMHGKVVASISDKTSDEIEGKTGGKKRNTQTSSESDSKKKFLKEDYITPEEVWRHGFCSCFGVLGNPGYWFALMFPWVLTGQLMQRLKLNFWGSRTKNHSSSCISVFFFGVFTLLAQGTLVLLFMLFQNNIYLILASAVFFYSMISFLYFNCVLRNTLRNGFDLPTTIVQDCCCDDFCTSLCCCYCCSLIQISRHTHDEKKFKYQLFSKTGLSSDANGIYYC